MAHARDDTTHLVAQKCTEVDVLENEFNALNTSIETHAFTCEEACAASRFELGKSKKTCEEGDRYKDEDERCHGS